MRRRPPRRIIDCAARPAPLQCRFSSVRNEAAPMTPPGPRTRLAALVVLVAALSAPQLAAAPAAVKGEGRARELQKLMDCRKLTDNAARLACYDEAAAAIDQAE